MLVAGLQELITHSNQTHRIANETSNYHTGGLHSIHGLHGSKNTHWLHSSMKASEYQTSQNDTSKLADSSDDWALAGTYIGIVVLNLLSALFSGLVIGLLSLDVTELEILKKCGTEKERRYAATIIPMRKMSNLLLCSLVIGNVIVNAGLQVLLDAVFPGIVGFISTTVCLTIVGEILPQAVCARYGLAIGAKTIWITWIVIIVTFPVAYPLAKVLDWCLGDEIAFVFDRERLQEYIRITKNYNNLDAQEINIITGALKIKKATVSQVMTKLKDVFMLGYESIINHQTIVTIIKRGFSRVPVYQGTRKNLIGVLMVKDLALVNPHDEISLRSMMAFYRHPTLAVDEYHTLDIALNTFREGKSHMAFVRDHRKRDIIGIVTLEDIIEEVLQVEINDETDIVTDNRELKHRPNAQIPNNLEAFHTHSGSSDQKKGRRPATNQTSSLNGKVIPAPIQALMRRDRTLSNEKIRDGTNTDSKRKK